MLVHKHYRCKVVTVTICPFTEIKGNLGSIASREASYMRISPLVTCKYLFACHRDTQAPSLDEYEFFFTAGALSSNTQRFEK